MSGIASSWQNVAKGNIRKSTASWVALSDSQATNIRSAFRIAIYYLPIFFMLLAFDWIANRSPASGLNVWNASAGLIIAMVCCHGASAILPSMAMSLISGLITRQAAEPVSSELIETVVVDLGYALVGMILASRHVGFDRSLVKTHSLPLLICVAAAIGGPIAALNVSARTLSGMLVPSDRWAAIAQSWLADMAAIVVIAPLVLHVLATRAESQRPFQGWSRCVLGTAVLSAAIAVAHHDPIRWLPLIILAVAMIGLISKLTGVLFALLALHLLIFARFELAPGNSAIAFDTHIAMLAMALIGLVVAVLAGERTAARQLINRQGSDLDRVSRLKTLGALGVAIAHEIKQPLTAARAYVEVATNALSPGQEALGVAIANARKAAAHIDRAASLVDRARWLIEPSRRQLAPVEFADAANDAIEILRPDAERLGVTIALELSNRALTVQADPLLLRQALINLVRNALDALKDSDRLTPHVAIFARRGADGSVAIGVRDNGPGFPPGFELQRSAQSAGGESGGLGVGLWLCQSIADWHGWRLEAHNLDGGAEVSFSLA